MALIKCEECGKEVSDSSKSCVHCGGPIVKKIKCEECNYEVKSTVKTCPNCGNVLIKQNIPEKYRNLFRIVIILVIIAIIVLCINTYNKKESMNFEKIYEEIGCDSYYCELADDNSYLEIDTNPSDIDDYSNYEVFDYIKKANEKLEFKENLYTKMGKTRAMDGMQTDENEYVKVNWTYHPDNGLEVIYSIK